MSNSKIILLLLAVVFFVLLWQTRTEAKDPIHCGIASYYHDKFQGRRSADGSVFSQNKLTAAHKTLKFGTKVKVVAKSGKSVVVRITDRGPFVPGRIIDLSKRAARELGMIEQGLMRVCIYR